MGACMHQMQPTPRACTQILVVLLLCHVGVGVVVESALDVPVDQADDGRETVGDLKSVGETDDWNPVYDDLKELHADNVKHGLEAEAQPTVNNNESERARREDRSVKPHDFQRVLWIHVPKCGGTSLASVAQIAAGQHNSKIAWCYQHSNEQDCAHPEHTLASAHPYQQFRFVDFLPDSESWDPASERLHAEPMMVYGHGVRYNVNARWKLQGKPLYVMMFRHPLDRVFSAFFQFKRDKNSVHYHDTIAQFMESCALTGRMPGGPLEEFLFDKGLDKSIGADGSPLSLDERVAKASQILRQPNMLVLLNERWDASMELLIKMGVLTSSQGVMTSSSFESSTKRFNRNKDLALMLELPYSAIKDVRRCISLEERVYATAVEVFVQRYHDVVGGNMPAR
eukprot:m.150469 g.150469  ORF g.150469 m.150469 type:complete len:397 (-) comp30728_c0_seq1:199-1389(-)